MSVDASIKETIEGLTKIIVEMKSEMSTKDDIMSMRSEIFELKSNMKTLEYQMDIVKNQPNDSFVNAGFRKALSKAAVIGASRQVNPSYIR